MTFLYPVFYLSALLLFAGLVWALCRKAGLGTYVAAILSLQYALGMGAAAHLGYYVVARHTLSKPSVDLAHSDLLEQIEAAPSLAHFTGWAERWFETTGGLWGGPLFVLLFCLVMVVVWRLDVRLKGRMLDIVAVALPFACALAKVGCMFAGCCHGVEGQGLFYLRFDWVSPTSVAFGRTFFPSQLLDAVILATLGGWLAWRYRKGAQQGRLVLWYVLLLSLARFASELTRGDDRGSGLLGLTPVQLVLVVAFVASALFLAVPSMFDRVLRFRAPNSCDDQPAGGDVASQGDEVLRVVRRRQRNLFLAFVGLAIVWPITVLFPLFFALPLIRNILRLRRDRRPDVWMTAFNQACYVGLGAIQLTTFLLGNLLPALVTLLLFQLGLSLALSRAPREAIAAQGAG